MWPLPVCLIYPRQLSQPFIYPSPCLNEYIEYDQCSLPTIRPLIPSLNVILYTWIHER